MMLEMQRLHKSGARPAFCLGQVVLTRAVNHFKNENEEFRKFLAAALDRYECADWGDTLPDSVAQNVAELAALPARGVGAHPDLLGVYNLPPGIVPPSGDTALWFKTEAQEVAEDVIDRVTTILWPSDY